MAGVKSWLHATHIDGSVCCVARRARAFLSRVRRRFVLLALTIEAIFFSFWFFFWFLWCEISAAHARSGADASLAVADGVDARPVGSLSDKSGASPSGASSSARRAQHDENDAMGCAAGGAR